MKRTLSFLLLVIGIIACTKEVPEGTKKISKSAEEITAAIIVEDFFVAYNSNDVEKAISFCDADYKEVLPDSDDVVGINGLRNDLARYRKQYPEGKWEIKIEETIVSGEFAYVMSKESFLMPAPVAENMNPIYSERSIRILKRQKDNKWKIFRYIGVPTFSYDNN